MAWRWMFGVTAIPSLLFLAGTFFVPESPRWLAKSGRYEQARAVLAKVGGDAYAGKAMAEIRATLQQAHPGSISGTLPIAGCCPILVLGIVLAVFQQWCGINVLFNYATVIFKAAGYPVADVLWISPLPAP